MGTRSARLAVLLSGSGRSLENLAEVIAASELEARIELVISSRRKAYALVRAERLGLESLVLRPRDFESALAYSEAVFAEIRSREIDLVCLMGFLTLLLVPEGFEKRVLNIHPALLPEFGGKGMYGERVHRAVLAAGRGVSGCTVHLCDNEYDHGPILLRRECPVLPDDSPDSLAARVFEEEKIAYPEALRRLIAGGLPDESSICG
ncbi:MAG: phosphoribosylglycinamide formyltransferase [Planctomycetota bacterium]